MIRPYTLATYKVLPGKEDAFIEAWKELAATFSSLPDPPYWGTLIQSTKESTLFHSFGPWEDPTHVAAMRTNPAAGAAFGVIKALCTEMTAGDYDVVTRVTVRPEPA